MPNWDQRNLRAAVPQPAQRAKADGIRLGVVGLGYWGSKHVRALSGTSGVAAIVGIDVRPDGAPGRGQAGPGMAEYRDVGAALSSVDALIIATPPSSHAEIGLQAIAAGKHVLIEKPLATSSRQARALIEAASSAGVVLMSGHTFEHNAAVHKLRDLVRNRDLGQLFYLDCARLNLGLYRTDVGVIADLAPHDISIANFVLGSRPTTVSAWASRYVDPQHEDVAHIRLDYADVGVRANLQVSWLSPVKVRRITMAGSRRMAVYDDLAEDDRIRVFDRSAVLTADGSASQQVAYRRGDTLSPQVNLAEPLVTQDQHFIDCIRTGRQPSSDGSSGLGVVQAVEAAELSVREQRPVALAEVGARQPVGIAGEGAA
jgi:predicted dehydrogenase